MAVCPFLSNSSATRPPFSFRKIHICGLICRGKHLSRCSRTLWWSLETSQSPSALPGWQELGSPLRLWAPTFTLPNNRRPSLRGSSAQPPSLSTLSQRSLSHLYIFMMFFCPFSTNHTSPWEARDGNLPGVEEQQWGVGCGRGDYKKSNKGWKGGYRNINASKDVCSLNNV